MRASSSVISLQLPKLAALLLVLCLVQVIVKNTTTAATLSASSTSARIIGSSVDINAVAAEKEVYLDGKKTSVANVKEPKNSKLKAPKVSGKKKRKLRNKGKKGDINWKFLIQSFFRTLFDPEYGGLGNSRSRAAPVIKDADFTAATADAGGSFGPVCGPDGCA